MLAIFSRVSRYAPVEAIRKTTLPTASNGKVTNVTSASGKSRNSRITTTPTSVSVLETSVTTPSVTSVSSASTSFVSREISTPGLFRVKNPIDIPCRCV